MDELEKEIGEAAGKVWKILSAKGPLPKTRIAKAANVSPTLANMAIGWLAREGKLELRKEKTSELIGLKA
jgi:predicted transcriptional regulator